MTTDSSTMYYSYFCNAFSYSFLNIGLYISLNHGKISALQIFHYKIIYDFQ